MKQLIFLLNFIILTFCTYEASTSIYFDDFFIKLYTTEFDNKQLIEHDLNMYNYKIINYRYFPYTDDWIILNKYPDFLELKYNRNSNYLNIYNLERINGMLYMYYDRYLILNKSQALSALTI